MNESIENLTAEKALQITKESRKGNIANYLELIKQEATKGATDLYMSIKDMSIILELKNRGFKVIEQQPIDVYIVSWSNP